MRPRRTHKSNRVFSLEGGTEDNDLWVFAEAHGVNALLHSTWELTAHEREQVAAGANVELTVWGPDHPPVDMRVTTVPLGRKENA